MSANDWLRHRFTRWILFVATTLLPIIVVIHGFILPIQVGLSEREAEVARRSKVLARLRGIANYDPKKALADKLIASPNNHYLVAPNEGVGSAKLQLRLQSFTQANGTELRLVQGLPARTEGTVRLIGARLELAGSIQTVHKAIASIESARPYLFVESASLRLVQQRRLPGRSTAEPLIEARLDVFGAFIKGEMP